MPAPPRCARRWPTMTIAKRSAICRAHGWWTTPLWWKREGGMNKVAEDLGPTPERRLGPPGHIDALTGVESVNATGFSVRHSRVGSAAVSLTRFAEDFLGQPGTRRRVRDGESGRPAAARFSDGHARSPS
jgi:hypothetical protein